MESTLPTTFRCYLVDRTAEGAISASLTSRRMEELPEGDVVVRVAYSSLNYKDAMAATGHGGIVRRFPHVPGVDAAGTVAASDAAGFHVGDEVLVTGFDSGAGRWGGWAEYLRVPHDWIVPRPEGLSLRETMILGTAGLTAALSIDALQRHDVRPESGPIVVTGATGGVGSVAVAVLANLGYDVAAVTGKQASHDYLRRLGASKVIAREEVDDRSGRPLLSARWAGGIDTVGGNILGTLLRSTRHGGCVTACGLAASNELPVTVYPFILRAVTLAGIDAAFCSIEQRVKMWRRLAGEWKPPQLAAIAQDTTLSAIDASVTAILRGQTQGRTVIHMHTDRPLTDDG